MNGKRIVPDTHAQRSWYTWSPQKSTPGLVCDTNCVTLYF